MKPRKRQVSATSCDRPRTPGEGIRIEELTELSHHGLVQYRLPTTGEMVPLLQIAPSKSDAERLLVISPELADVLSAIIRRIRGGDGAVPLVAAYDDHERVWLPPAPVLFQRRIGAENRPIPAATIRKLLAAALARTGLTGPSGEPLHYTPHDFRRMFLTDAKVSGVALDASFSRSRERALAAPQRAAPWQTRSHQARAPHVTWDVIIRLHWARR